MMTLNGHKMTMSETLGNHIAVIPARSGSKRLKNKNLKTLHNKPLIEWSIVAALEANIFSRIIVSTDSEHIASVALAAGAEVPCLRPKALAADDSASVDVGLELLESLAPEQYETLTWLQPTSPLRNANDIIAAHKTYRNKLARCVVSVCECEHSPLWMGRLGKDNNMQDFIDTKINIKRSQDLPDYVRLNGAIYIVDVNQFVQQKSFFLSGGKSFAYKMPQQRSIDIDTQWDFDLAEFVFSRGF